MSSAGYGNHDGAKPGSATGERPSAEAASAKPGAGSEDRPGMDLGGAGDLSGASGAMAGTRSQPDPGGAAPHPGSERTGTPTITADRDVATPGEGAGPAGSQGNEADPGLG